jgi:hypothetical protein
MLMMSSNSGSGVRRPPSSPGEFRRDEVTADVSLRVAVQQQDGVTAPASDEVGRRPSGVDSVASESFKHGRIYVGVAGRPPTKAIAR